MSPTRLAATHALIESDPRICDVTSEPPPPPSQIAQQLEREALLNPTLRGKRKPATDAPTKPANRSQTSGATGTPAGPVQPPQTGGATTQTPRQGTGLWKHRPFSRVVRGYRAYKIVRDYVKLNELEAQGRIPYRKTRLRGMSSADWEILWA